MVPAILLYNVFDIIVPLYNIIVLLQGVLDDFDDLILAVGSGGSAAGLAIANYLTGSKIK